MVLAHSVHRPLEFTFPECGVAVLESHHAGDFRMPMQSASYAKILHPLDGRGRLHLKNRSEPLAANCVCLLPPGISHAVSDLPGSPLTLMVVCFRAKMISHSLPPGAVFTRRPPIIAVMRRLLRAMLAEQSLRKAGWGIMLVSHTLHLLALSGRACATTIRPGEMDQRATRQRVEGYLQRDRTCHLKPASLDEIAAELQISRRSLTASLRELRGRSWLDWVREQRVSHATDLLKKTDRSVASIAFECGFEDLSSFYRAFRKLAGTNPSRWRADQITVK